MIASYQAFKLISAVCMIAALAACSQANGPQPGAAAAVDEDSPAYRAFEYRHGLMHVIGPKAATLRGMAKGDIPPDDARFRKAASDLAALSTMLLEGFPEGSGGVTGSRALPDIWNNWDDFQAKARDFETAAAALADAALTGGFAGGQGSVQAVADACGGCHRTYRADED
jgi:cytochrome c556